MGIPKVGVGFWKDIRAAFDFSDHPDPRLPDPHPMIPSGEREAIARYLDNGTVEESYLGFSYCRFECGKPDSEMGTCDMTDGVFVWPEGYSHYVRDHGTNLPEGFLKHIRSRLAQKR